MIDKGHIVERGTHETLLAKEGVYKKLVLRQLSTSQHSADGAFDLALLEPGKPSIEDLYEDET